MEQFIDKESFEVFWEKGFPKNRKQNTKIKMMDYSQRDTF